jgi:STE24 endopeptidase
MHQGAGVQERAREYSLKKYTLALLDTAVTLILLIVFLATGLSRALAEGLGFIFSNSYFTVPVYLLVVILAYYLITFPLTFYQSYTLEHEFSLSRQSLKDWLLDQLKSGAISYSFGLILIAAFYFILNKFPGDWWLVIGVFWIFFSIVMAKLLPVLIIPMFFKYKKIEDEALRQKIIVLAGKMKVKLLDVFEIDLSKKSLKGNAAFVGVGNTRRVLLADTLKDKYTHEEIEVILAHEFAHYRLRHLLKLILINSVVTLVIFFVIYATSSSALWLFGLSSYLELAALPLLFLYFAVFGVILQPLGAFISRCFERSADRMAIEVTGLKEAFISTMDKLGDQNLADRNPHPLIKLYFFDHPPIDERIEVARKGDTHFPDLENERK